MSHTSEQSLPLALGAPPGACCSNVGSAGPAPGSTAAGFIGPRGGRPFRGVARLIAKPPFGTHHASRITHHVSRITFHVSRSTLHAPLLLILLIFTGLTLYQSIVLPLGEADDETDHYQYLRFVAQTGHPPFTETERNEAGFKGGLAPLYYWLTAWPVALVGEDTLPDIRRVDARPERHIPTDGLGLNHVLHTLDEQWPWRGQVLAWHLVRLLSLPMAWITIIATYALVHRLWPEPKIIALGAAAFIAFLPRFVSSSAVINDDNLVFALTTLLLLTQVIILQDTQSSPRIFAIFGALFGLALITKYLAIILIPEVIFTLFVYQVASSKAAGSRVADRQSPQDHPSPTHSALPSVAGQAADRQPTFSIPNTTDYAPRSRAKPPLGTLHAPPSTLLSFLAALILTAGPWFAFITLRFNRINELGLIPGLAASLGEPQVTEGLVGLLSGQSIRPIAATYNLPEWLGLLYRSFWFEYGWMRVFAPNWVYGLFTVFLLLAAMGHVLRAAYYMRRKTQHVTVQSLPLGMFYFSPIFWLLGLHLILFVIVVLTRYVLSATIDTGQGRHLYPALPVIALLISFGLTQLGFRSFPAFATDLLPALMRFLPASRHLLPATCYLLPATFYLLPAALCLYPLSFILLHYSTLPVTITPPADLPITYRHTFPFADGLSLAGFDVATTVSAGETLPVTLYWRADQEAQQDYLVFLCLHSSNDNQPVACWAGHFAAGRYPARAWEVDDTLRDTVFIPIPTCYRILDQIYRLHLEVWPLAPDSPEPALDGPPVLQQTFAEPLISIRTTDSLLQDLPQTVDLWRSNQRLTGPTSITLAESVTWLDYTNPSQNQAPKFIRQATGASTQWSPLAELNTPLFLPCDDGPTPFAQLAHFIAGPALPPGPYFPNDTHALPDLSLSLNLRHRTFAPISSTLTFTPYLAPLSLKFPGQPPINFLEKEKTGSLEKNSNLPTFQPSNPPSLHPSNPFLPITIRWQARRWMADPLIISLKLLDKDFKIGGERVATLGDRYPNVLWAPTEIIEETYPLRLNADAPPGLYQLEMSLLRQDKNLPDGYAYLPLTSGEINLGHNLYPATFRLLDPADGTPPPHPFSAQLGDAIHLTGYDLNLQSHISLALYWQSTAKIPTDYTVFTKLLGPDGQDWAQWDNPPQAGRYPTTAWAENDMVVDRYILTLREDAPTGSYRLLVGMYDPATGQRLPATINDQLQPDNAIELTTLTIDN